MDIIILMGIVLRFPNMLEIALFLMGMKKSVMKKKIVDSMI